MATTTDTSSSKPTWPPRYWCNMTDAEIHALERWARPQKAARGFCCCGGARGQPTVIWPKQKRVRHGWRGRIANGCAPGKETRPRGITGLRDRFDLPLSDKAVESLEFFRPSENSVELSYSNSAERNSVVLSQRSRCATSSCPQRPSIEQFANCALTADGKEMSTTMAAVRMFGGLLKDKTFGKRLSRSLPMRLGHSVWTTCFGRWVSIRRSAL